MPIEGESSLLSEINKQSGKFMDYSSNMPLNSKPSSTGSNALGKKNTQKY